ncbi:MAG TPA: AMP-binding protein [Acidimicrobiales bacterium]|jgi:long-chain acyl-CoA synthetase|nr:AMP-binding protein [Acidimicrobiales bacterium]
MTTPERTPTVGDILTKHARGMGDRVAVVCGDVRLTWRQLDERVDRLAAALAADGVGRGDQVLWLGQNCHRLLEGLLAAGRLGAIFCPANWRQSPAELAFVIDDVEPKVVIWQETEVGEPVAAARRQSSAAAAHWVQHDGPGDTSEYEDYLAAIGPSSFTAPLVDADDPFVMIYTAAFEGRPNGALLSHRAWLHQNMVTAYIMGTTAEDVCLCCSPMFHVGMLRHALSAFQLGGRNVIARRVEAEDLCRLIDAEHCTVTFLQAPTMAQMAACNADGRYDLSSLRSAPGTPEWNAMVTVDERPLRNGFGQTELAGIITFASTRVPGIGAAGRPIPVAEVEVVDSDGNILGAGGVGELVVRGPMVMNGYHRRPELNAQRRRGGWHHTNDLGRREEDGTLSFVGPVTRIVKSASENIYPSEVEACIRAHPQVREVGIIGVPDPVWTQSVLAVVVPEDGATITGEDVVEHCRLHIASYKKPRHVEFLDALPRSPDGAVNYDALDEKFGGGGYPAK